MLSPFPISAGLGQLSPDSLRGALENFLPKDVTSEKKIRAIEAALKSPAGEAMRETMARWIVDEIVPVGSLVPESYSKWRLPVRDAMVFVVTRLSSARLAPKLLEQVELPADTRPEERLLRLIAKVPGLQKLGQVIARNQHLRPALRRALARLENGIRDVSAEEIHAIIRRNLGERMERFAVKIAPGILSEASVSAVVRFTWHNPESGRRENGVFKVLKPHIPEYFAEDMEYLQGLAEYFAERQHTYGFPARLIPDTFRKVRRLLRYEVNFRREQKTLIEAAELYRSMSGVRIPRLIGPLCTPEMTALSEERGIKITSAVTRLPATRRRQVAEQLIEALVAVPLFAATQEAIFHGDPHAGNLLYDQHTGQLCIIDWALRERLGRAERRHLTLLFLMVSLRDPVGASGEIIGLSRQGIKRNSPRARMIHELARDFLQSIPASKLPSAADAMRLLERVALKGIRFPASLIMLSKVMFTLEGILGDVVGLDTAIGLAIARRVAGHWLANRRAYRSPLETRDWVTLQCSALLYAGRLWVEWEQTVLNRLLKPKGTSISAPGVVAAATGAGQSAGKTS
ncbi:MAG TPA: AarF/UbiB family protein [Terriglobales bacterium]|nr:AarF/UbiB family protein [Terriglobales bacterium]